VYTGPEYKGTVYVEFDSPIVAVGSPESRVSAEILPSGIVTMDVDLVRVFAADVATGSAMVLGDVLIGEVGAEPPSKLFEPSRMEIMAVAMTSDEDCCDAPEVDTTMVAVGAAVEDAAGPVRVKAVGFGSALGDDVVEESESPFDVMITAAWAVMAVKDRTVTFCTGSAEVVVGVT